MSKVLTHQVKESLAELADAEYQATLWLGRLDGYMGSPSEAAEQLIHDSGLGAALERGTIFDTETDEHLARAIQALDLIDLELAPRDVLDSSEIESVRRSALAALCALVRYEYQESNLPKPGS